MKSFSNGKKGGNEHGDYEQAKSGKVWVDVEKTPFFCSKPLPIVFSVGSKPIIQKPMYKNSSYITR